MGDILGEQVMEFSGNGKSFSREIEQTESGVNIKQFYETAKTPGKMNEKKSLNK